MQQMYIEVKMKRHEFTFPAPEQLEHRSVLGGESGWSPLFNVESGSIRTSDPVLEQRAQARYPVRKTSSISTNVAQHNTYIQNQKKTCTKLM